MFIIVKFHRPLAFILLLLSSFQAEAQESFFGDEVEIWSSKLRIPKQIEYGDVNNDGLEDLLVSSADEPTIYVLHNLGNRSFSFAQTLYESLNPMLGFLVGDFNNDGFADILVCEDTTSGFKVLLNQGDESFQIASSIDGPLGSNNSFQTIDLDQDGLLDFVYGKCWYKNLGNGSFSACQQIVDEAPLSIDFGDIDQDGDLDLLILDPVKCYIALNNGLSDFSAEETFVFDIDMEELYHHVSFFDANSNGLLDVVANKDGLRTFHNNGDGSYSAQPKLTDVGARTVDYADFNEDGLIDLLVSVTNQSLYWIENNGDGNFAFPIAVSAGQPGQDHTVFDSDKDGVKDVSISNSIHGIWTMYNEGGVLNTIQIHLDKLSLLYGLYIRDLDHNGVQDFVFNSYYGLNIYLNLDLENWSEAKSQHIIGAPYGFEFADVDQDGFEDLILKTYEGLQYSRFNGVDSFEEPQSLVADPELFFGNIALIDINMDSVEDLLIGADVCYSYEPSLNGQCQSLISGNEPIYNIVYHEDVNGDGHLDLIVIPLGTYLAKCYFNNGVGDFSNSLVIDSSVQSFFLQFYDLDNDGQTEIILYTGGSISAYSFNDGSFERRLLTEKSGIPMFHDINADGYVDMLFIDGDLTCLFNNGKNEFTIEKSRALEREPQAVHFNDYNGDQILDLGLIYDETGSSEDRWFYFEGGSGSFLPEASFTWEECKGISITNTSSAYVPESNVSWAVNDKTISTDFHLADHREFFPDVGDYEVSLTICNENGCDTYSETISIDHVYQIEFPEIVAVNLPVHFATNAIGYDAVSWVLGDGSVYLDDSFTHAFTEPGDYQVEIFLTDPAFLGCTYSEELTIRVLAPEPGKIFVWPNPSNDMVKVASLDKELMHLSLVNAQGEEALSLRAESYWETMNIGSLARGLYILNITFADGSSLREKLILR